MRVLNTSFGFTIKLGGEHFGGFFNYHHKGIEQVKMSFRRLPRKPGKGFVYEQVYYFRCMNDRWILWDLDRKAPRQRVKGDSAAYAVFREAFGLAQLAEA